MTSDLSAPHPPRSSDLYDVIVVGGGLAGAAFGAHLARRGRSVLVLERQRYPADKLCGEFLSVEALGLFGRLGVRGAVLAAGAVPVRQSVLTAPDGSAARLPLPGTALGLTRRRLDALLLAHARACGADARDGTPVRRVERRPDGLFEVGWDGGEARARLAVGAWGKRSGLDGHLGRAFLREPSPWVAFKAHFAGDDVEDRVEIHAFPGGYGGVSPVEDGLVNVCWIGTRAALAASGGTPDGMLRGALRANPHLARRLDRLTRVSARYEAVAAVTFTPRGTTAPGGVLLFGDTAGMIAPVCGDGMSIALHGAEAAAPLVDAFLDGRLSEAELHAAHAAAWDRAYRGRLRLGRALHHAFARPAVAAVAVRLAAAFPRAAGVVVRRTRGAPQ